MQVIVVRLLAVSGGPTLDPADARAFLAMFELGQRPLLATRQMLWRTLGSKSFAVLIWGNLQHAAR